MCCPPVLVLCTARIKVLRFFYTRDVGKEQLFILQVGFDDTGFFAVLRGVIQTTAQLSSIVKKRPDKEMSAFVPSDKASCLFVPKKKRPKRSETIENVLH